MSELHKLSELSKYFTPEMWKLVEIETEKLRIEWGLPEIPEEYEMTDDDICWPNADPNFGYDRETLDTEATEAADDD